VLYVSGVRWTAEEEDERWSWERDEVQTTDLVVGVKEVLNGVHV